MKPFELQVMKIQPTKTVFDSQIKPYLQLIAGVGRFNCIIIISSGLVLMGATIENISIAFVLPYAKCDLQMSTTEQGLISSIAFLGIVLSAHFWGFLADTWGRKKTIRLAAICALISALLSAFAMNATIMIILRFLVGIL